MTTKDHTAALLPCPFCGSTEIFIEPDEIGSGGQWVAPAHVGCARCQAEHCADDTADAIKAWNTRANPQQPSGWRDIASAPKDGTRVLLWATRYSMLNPSPQLVVGRYDRGWWADGGVPLSHLECWMPTRPPTAHPSQQEDDERDGARYRWLTEDHADPAVRAARKFLLRRMSVMSYSAASRDIDAAMSAAQGDAAQGGGNAA